MRSYSTVIAVALLAAQTSAFAVAPEGVVARAVSSGAGTETATVSNFTAFPSSTGGVVNSTFTSATAVATNATSVFTSGTAIASNATSAFTSDTAIATNATTTVSATGTLGINATSPASNATGTHTGSSVNSTGTNTASGANNTSGTNGNNTVVGGSGALLGVEMDPRASLAAVLVFGAAVVFGL